MPETRGLCLSEEQTVTNKYNEEAADGPSWSSRYQDAAAEADPKEVMEKGWIEKTEEGMVMNLKEKESSLEGNVELTNSVHESKGEQNLGVVTITEATSHCEFFKLDHHKYWVPLLTRMEGDDGSCMVFLPPHHIVDASSFRFTVCVLLMGKSPYSHCWVLVEEPRHRPERLLQVAKEHFYEIERCLLYSIRNDIESFRIAFGTIFNEHSIIQEERRRMRLAGGVSRRGGGVLQFLEVEGASAAAAVLEEEDVGRGCGGCDISRYIAIYRTTYKHCCTYCVWDQHGIELSENKEHTAMHTASRTRSRSEERGKRNFKHLLIKQVLISQVACLAPPLCLVTEFMSSGRVFDDLQTRQSILKLPGTLKITIDVTEGMCYLHQNTIIRRCLKVANLLMDENKVLMNINAAVFCVAQVLVQLGIMTAKAEN
ncbi:hypothetical protein SASPL_101455 [Salvia splendens]|uniref:Protein kinase domain-containing protein n=1 Tax=Salvia splendens TaxID=180675 RepID=A0A8X8YPB0_SALSN|nr:hypothetical protein SASPL_101454 [Salvia splendens]KAG6436554.1 hypothetical protein SASPL_101455 [Salvia splendens]